MRIAVEIVAELIAVNLFLLTVFVCIGFYLGVIQ